MAFLGPVDFGSFATALTTLPQGIVGALQGTIGAVQSTMSVITGIFSKLKLLYFLGLFVSLGKCFILFFTFVWKCLKWLFVDFISWLFAPWPPNVFEPGRKYDKFQEAGVLPWAIRFFIVLATKVAKFPKCFIWYIIDIVIWTLYLPFRFVFWLLDFFLNVGIVRGEHKLWNILNDIDYYIHGPVRNYFLDQYVAMYVGDKMHKDGEIVANPRPKKSQSRENKLTGAKIPIITFDKFTYTDTNKKEKIIDVEKEQDTNSKNRSITITDDNDSLNLGFHIIHFPNDIMTTCYSATNYSLAGVAPFPMEDFNNFFKCLTNFF